MVYVTTKAGKGPSRRGMSFAGPMALAVAALASASGVAAWISDFDPVAWIPVASVSEPAAPKNITTSFDERFSLGSAFNFLSADIPRNSFVRSLPSEIEIKFQQAKGRLAQQLQSQDWRQAFNEAPATSRIEEPASSSIGQPAPSSVAAVPLPRTRPVEANPESRNSVAAVQGPVVQASGAPAPGAQADNRTLLQKLSDLLPARVTLASLAPDGGLFRQGPDLAALGYDNMTAVYDISARAVYLPDGSKLEAHSGLGNLMDDPGHVNERNAGATPPNVYDLKPREQLFHGVPALRMIPVTDDGTGRSGLLAHSYMLGPKGDSNGCVSIRDYEKFRNAFARGEIKRLVVVPSLGDGASASQRSTSQS